MYSHVSNDMLYELIRDFKSDVNRRFTEIDRRFEKMNLPALTYGVSKLRGSFATFQAPLVVLWTKYIHPPAYTGGTLEPASCAGSFMRAHGASAQQDEACGSATAEAKRALSNTDLSRKHHPTLQNLPETC